MPAPAALLLVLSAGRVRAAASAPPRPPAVAGQFYSADPDALAKEVDAFFARASTAPPRGRVVALLVPHAGHPFSGATAAAAFAVADPADFDSVVMVGTGHNVAVEGAALYAGPYATPLGAVPYDEALGEALRAASPLVRANAAAHAGEHSIEVNLPFLQRRFPKTKLAALVMNTGDLAKAAAVGEALAAAARGRRVLLVASSDLSHYPPASVAERVDDTSLAALRTLDAGFFWRTNRLLMGRRAENLVCTYCGEAAVEAVTTAARLLGADRLELLAQTNSAKALPEAGRERVVGYAAAAFIATGAGPERSAYDLTGADKEALLAAARDALAKHLAHAPEPGPELSEKAAFNLPAAVFVTLDTREGGSWRLRGCVGSLTPQGSLLDAVRRFALAAGFQDERFEPLRAEELARLRVEVSVLSPTRAVRDVAEIRPGVDGVVVDKGGRSGVFLPQVWETFPDKKEFLSELCRQKAGLDPDCAADAAARFSVFTVESFAEKG